MDNSNDEYVVSDDVNEDTDDEESNEFSDIPTRRKEFEEIKEVPLLPHAKKIRINSKTKKKSFVWNYFQVEGGRDICKVLIFSNGNEYECKKSYKHDGGTGNMKLHLSSIHGIVSDNIQLKDSNQLRIDMMVKKLHHIIYQNNLN
ncbi:unnamed protein product [Rhizophagus irregularis]|nr:unnamed protein product [Rhizophagus irregularis]